MSRHQPRASVEQVIKIEIGTSDFETVLHALVRAKYDNGKVDEDAQRLALDLANFAADSAHMPTNTWKGIVEELEKQRERDHEEHLAYARGDKKKKGKK